MKEKVANMLNRGFRFHIHNFKKDPEKLYEILCFSPHELGVSFSVINDNHVGKSSSSVAEILSVEVAADEILAVLQYNHDIECAEGMINKWYISKIVPMNALTMEWYVGHGRKVSDAFNELISVEERHSLRLEFHQVLLDVIKMCHEDRKEKNKWDTILLNPKYVRLDDVLPLPTEKDEEDDYDEHHESVENIADRIMNPTRYPCELFDKWIAQLSIAERQSLHDIIELRY
jgi:hypothetical protein